jgi:hypothetical protein
LGVVDAKNVADNENFMKYEQIRYAGHWARMRLNLPLSAVRQREYANAPGHFLAAFCRCCAVMVLAVLFLWPSRSAMAEPDRAVRFLMEAPVSMLDWGLKNIEDHLMRNREILTKHEKELFHKEPSVSADYDWSGDVIRISIGLRLSGKIQKTTDTLAEVNEWVAFIIKYVRGVLTMNPYDAYFRHKGFRSRETPENLDEKLSESTELVVTVRDTDSNILSMCKAPLVGEDMVWLKIGEQ